MAHQLFPKPETLALKGIELQLATTAHVTRLATSSLVKDLGETFELRVGGSVMTGEPSKDIDLILRPLDHPAINLIEDTLITIRQYGFNTLGCRIDPLINELTEDEIQRYFALDKAFELISLESPQSLEKPSSKKMKRLSRILLMTRMKPSERSFYKKLPLVDGKPNLRPALLLSDFL